MKKVKEGVKEEVKKEVKVDMQEFEAYVKKLTEQMEMYVEEQDTFLKQQIKNKDALIDQMHKELSYYTSESASKFENELLKAIIKIREDMKRQMSKMTTEEKAEHCFKEYEYIYEDITDLLERQMCDEVVTEEGEKYDPSIHTIKVESTDNPELDKTVKKSINAGYKKRDKLLIPERVIVYKYKEN